RRPKSKSWFPMARSVSWPVRCPITLSFLCPFFRPISFVVKSSPRAGSLLSPNTNP
ncbi:hypothetical protein KXW22_006976, partial [Aspergillus fumigatus]